MIEPYTAVGQIRQGLAYIQGRPSPNSLDATLLLSFLPFPSPTLPFLGAVKGSGAELHRNRIWCILALKYDIWCMATISMIFLRINLRNSAQFKKNQGKSGPRVILFKAIFFSFH